MEAVAVVVEIIQQAMVAVVPVVVQADEADKQGWEVKLPLLWVDRTEEMEVLLVQVVVAVLDTTIKVILQDQVGMAVMVEQAVAEGAAVPALEEVAAVVVAK
jgi:hypothetical protein